MRAIRPANKRFARAGIAQTQEARRAYRELIVTTAGLGPVFWLLISELYPVRIRGTAMSVATIANWAANFAVTISFLTLLNAIRDSGTFFLFAALTLVALAHFISRCPRPRASASSRSNAS
jgi:hypothetical protein